MSTILKNMMVWHLRIFRKIGSALAANREKINSQRHKEFGLDMEDVFRYNGIITKAGEL